MNRSIKTRTRYALVGADYSAQEVRVLAALSKDENMINAYAEGKDLYAVIGSMAFKNSYYQNLEFLPRLVDDEIHDETLDIIDSKIELLLDDKVLIANNVEKEAKDLVSGDMLITSDGTVTIKSISCDCVYVTIYL